MHEPVDGKPEMLKLSGYEAFTLLPDGPNGMPLVKQISQTLLDANLTMRSLNAVLHCVWYVIVDKGKIGPAQMK